MNDLADVIAIMKQVRWEIEQHILPSIETNLRLLDAIRALENAKREIDAVALDIHQFADTIQ